MNEQYMNLLDDLIQSVTNKFIVSPTYDVVFFYTVRYRALTKVILMPFTGWLPFKGWSLSGRNSCWIVLYGQCYFSMVTGLFSASYTFQWKLDWTGSLNRNLGIYRAPLKKKPSASRHLLIHERGIVMNLLCYLSFFYIAWQWTLLYHCYSYWFL